MSWLSIKQGSHKQIYDCRVRVDWGLPLLDLGKSFNRGKMRRPSMKVCRQRDSIACSSTATTVVYDLPMAVQSPTTRWVRGKRKGEGGSKMRVRGESGRWRDSWRVFSMHRAIFRYIWAPINNGSRGGMHTHHSMWRETYPIRPNILWGNIANVQMIVGRENDPS
jgi:hypothetical protein